MRPDKTREDVEQLIAEIRRERFAREYPQIEEYFADLIEGRVLVTAYETLVVFERTDTGAFVAEYDV